MPISFIASGAVSTGANPTVAVPAGFAKNDLLLIVTTGTATPATPATWTQLAAQGAGQFITVLYRYATTSESSVPLTLAGTTSRAFMMCYRGAGAFQTNATFTTGTGTTATTSTLTTTYTNNFVLSIVANLAGQLRTLSTPTGTTLVSTNNTSTTLNGLMVARETQAAAAASTARSSTIAQSSAWSALQISFIETRTVYWVGGNGSWTSPGVGTTGANWADTSGGAGGKIVPSQNDAVIVDGSSGSPTITLSGLTPSCTSLTTTGATCTFTGGQWLLNGSMTLSATTTWSTTGTIFVGGTGTITTNAVSITAPISIAVGSGQTVTLGDTLTTTGQLQLFSGTLTLNGFNANCLTFSGTGTTARSIAFGSNFVNITSTATATVLNCADVTNFTPTGAGGLKLTGAAASAITRTAVIGTTGGAVSTAPNVFVAAGAAGSIFALTTASWVRDLDFTGFSGTFAPAAATTITGSLTAVSGMTWTTGTGTITFASTSTGRTITTAGKILYNLIFNGIGGGWTLQDTLNFGTNIGDRADTSVTNGTFNTGNFTINGGSFSISGTASVNLGSSTLNLQDPSIPWSCAASATLNAGTSNIVITGTSNTFNGGSKTYYNVSFPGNTSNLINNNNTFNKISFNGSVTSAGTLEFDAGGNNTIGTFDIRGTAGNTPSITSQSTTQTTLTSLNNAIQSNIDYIIANDITFAPTPTSTGTVPYYWYIGANSSSNADTVGALFTSDTTYTYYELRSGTSWAVPSNWGGINNVYLFGAGGGGSGSVVASATGSHNSGSGGGGGGFTALTNVSLTPSGSAAYTIGAAGPAAGGSTTLSASGNGGTTTFLVTNSAGGGGGATTGLGTTTPGTAGIGSTTNGGTGGSGTAPNTNTSNAGGGGAGGGGLNGNGQSGGNNVTTTIGSGGAGNAAGNRFFIQALSNAAIGNFSYGRGNSGGTTSGAGATAEGFGGGGGGGGTLAGSATTRAGGVGTQGLIVIRYIPGSSNQTGNYFLLM
jgi:hypothetical protein